MAIGIKVGYHAFCHVTDTKSDIELMEKMIGSISVDRLTLLVSMPESETRTEFQKT